MREMTRRLRRSLGSERGNTPERQQEPTLFTTRTERATAVELWTEVGRAAFVAWLHTRLQRVQEYWVSALGGGGNSITAPEQ